MVEYFFDLNGIDPRTYKTHATKLGEMKWGVTQDGGESGDVTSTVFKFTFEVDPDCLSSDKNSPIDADTDLGLAISEVTGVHGETIPGTWTFETKDPLIRV